MTTREFSHFVALAKLSPRPQAHHLVAGETARAALTARFSLQSIGRLEAWLDVSRSRDGAELTGRLVAASESGLRTLRDAVAAQLLDPPTAGTLVDTTGRSWAGMSLVEYREEPAVDRGRSWSIAYTAVFRKYRAAP